MTILDMFKLKLEALSMSVKFQQMVERFFESKIKIVQPDWSGEFRPFLSFWSK